MKIGVLGTGMVGTTIATKLAANGHEVTLGSRSAGQEKAITWVRAAGVGASEGTLADAAAFGEMLFNCTPGAASLDALAAAGGANLEGKILVDVANPLEFAAGMPATLSIGNTDSLGERIQREFASARVVKALNTVNASVMVDPCRVKGDHDLFICGNDRDAKRKVEELLRHEFGWKSVIDLGDITNARAMEAYLLLWLRLWGALRTSDFNIRVVR